MDKKIVISNGLRVVVIYSDEPIITDAQTMLDLLATVHYNDDSNLIAINKEALCDEFFVLSTGVAGEILQKTVNYRMTLAIIGDFSVYTSKPLKDFMYECNNGRHVYFVEDEPAAIAKLTGGK